MTETQTISCTINGEQRVFDADPSTPLLYVLREDLGLRATRFGCGEATCGACTVTIDGKPVMSCDTPVGEVSGRHVETAEGLDTDPPHPLVASFLDLQA